MELYKEMGNSQSSVLLLNGWLEKWDRTLLATR
jgi:hypothetical protein